jgi:phosphatidylglycerol---prolipoprotein diacylglyceryl transferase
MLPKVFDIGSFYLPSYGLLVALAFLAAIWLTTRLATREGLDPEKVSNLALGCALAGMLGGKIAMIFFDWRIYAENPSLIFTREMLQSMGVFQGGLLLAIGFAFWYMRRNGMPALATSDVFAPGLALGHGIGRIGCFLAGCCWGQQCDRPWAVVFTNPDAHEMTGVPLGIPLHPTQLYESFAEFAIFFILLRQFRHERRPGSVIGLYLVLYSIVRFLVEFVRNHEQALPFGLPFSNTQWISVATLLIGVFLMVRPGAITQPRTSAA